jgi:hypothetical protein
MQIQEAVYSATRLPNQEQEDCLVTRRLQELLLQALVLAGVISNNQHNLVLLVPLAVVSSVVAIPAEAACLAI